MIRIIGLAVFFFVGGVGWLRYLRLALGTRPAKPKTRLSGHRKILQRIPLLGSGFHRLHSRDASEGHGKLIWIARMFRNYEESSAQFTRILNGKGENVQLSQCQTVETVSYHKVRARGLVLLLIRDAVRKVNVINH